VPAIASRLCRRSTSEIAAVELYLAPQQGQTVASSARVTAKLWPLSAAGDIRRTPRKAGSEFNQGRRSRDSMFRLPAQVNSLAAATQQESDGQSNSRGDTY